MNIKRFIVNSILGVILFNACFSLIALIRQNPFQFNVWLGVVVPIVAGFGSSLVLTPKEREARASRQQ